MALEKIKTGTTTGDRTGDGAKTAGIKINANFEYLENKIDNMNQLLVDAGFSLSGNVLTINAGWQWKINGINYTNPVAVAFTIPFAAAGKKRRDIIVMNTSNTFTKFVGAEVTGTAVTPALVAQTILLEVFNVTESNIYGSKSAAPFLGSITPASVPTGSGAAYWHATQAGTYTNFGSVVVAANSFAVISRNEAGGFSISQTALDLSTYASKSYVDGLVVGLLDDRGPYNASVNTFPTTGGSGASGAVMKGDLWYVSVAGTLGGKAVKIGACFRALVDAPAQVATNWSIFDASLGYIPENTTNKNSDIAADPTSTDKFPTNKGVVDYVAANGGAIKPFIDGAWPVDSQVNFLGKDWYNTVATVAGEIPGTSSKWVERLSGYLAKDGILNFTKISAPSALTFSPLPSYSTVSYNSTTGVLSVAKTASEPFAAASSNNELDFFIINKTPLIVVGTGLDYVLAVSTSINNIGVILKIDLNGVSTLGTALFPTTAVPVATNRIKVDASTEHVIISTSIDAGVTYIEWGRVLKTAFPFAYLYSKMGTLSTNAITIYSSQTKGDITKGLTINHSNLVQKTALDSENDYLLMMNNNDFGGGKKIKPADLINPFLQSSKTINFVPSLPALAFTAIPIFSIANYNTTTKLLSTTKTQGESWATAISNNDLNSIVLSTKPNWVVIGKGSDYAIVVSLFTANIGKVGQVMANGSLVLGLNPFPTTAIPTSTNRVRIDVNTTTISIYTSIDAGVNYVLWGSVLKSALGVPYLEQKLGILGIGGEVVKVESSSNKTGIGEGSYIISDNLVEENSDDDDYIFLLDPTKNSGGKKQSVLNFLTQYLPSTPFKGLKAVTYGDSITNDTNVTSGTYANFLKTKLKLGSVVKQAYGAHSIGLNNIGSLADPTKLDAIIALNPDLIVIMAGTNDYGSVTGVVLGSVNSTTITETLGGLRYIFRYFQKRIPTCSIVMCTPTPRVNQTTVNTEGKTLSEYVDGIKNVSKQYSIPVVDLFQDSGFGWQDVESTNVFLSDSVHLSLAGYDRITSIQANRINLIR